MTSDEARKHTYQLTVELQVDSPSKKAPQGVGDKWHTVLCDIIEDELEADHVTVSAFKCAKVLKTKLTDQGVEDVGLTLGALRVEARRRVSALELISDEAEYNEAERKAQRCCHLITGLERYLGLQHIQAPYGRCKECGKTCHFDHDVPAEELVCDVCAGAPEDEIDW